LKRTICILLSALFLQFLCAASDGLHLSTVVIDAGHGGKDPGAVSKDGRTYEKTIVMDISKRLADKITSNYPDVKVILTRDCDEFIELKTRTEIANKADASLFISIHINAARNTSASGYSVHVMGQSSRKDTDLYELNMASVMRENSVIKYEDDYTATYEGFDPSDPESYIFMQLMQNAYLEQSLDFAQVVKNHLSGGPIRQDRGIWQNPFYVLWRTSMPAVLIELGFISNSSDLSVIRNASDRETISERLFRAFREYKSNYDRSLNSEDSPAAELNASSPAEKQAVPSQAPSAYGTRRYGVQIFSVSSVIPASSPQFLGYVPEVIVSGKVRKYIISVSSSPSVPLSNLQSIRKKYPDAFIVEIDGDTLVPYRQ